MRSAATTARHLGERRAQRHSAARRQAPSVRIGASVSMTVSLAVAHAGGTSSQSGAGLWVKASMLADIVKKLSALTPYRTVRSVENWFQAIKSRSRSFRVGAAFSTDKA